MAIDKKPGKREYRSLFWRWKWALLIPTMVCIGLCLAIAFSDTLAGLFCASADELRPASERERQSVRESRPRADSGDPGQADDLGYQYESQAILEIQDNRPIDQESAWARSSEALALGLNVREAELAAIRVHMLSLSAIRDIVLSRRVRFGREIDPDDHCQLDRLYHAIRRCTRIELRGRRYVCVAHRGRNPRLNAGIVNELVKRFVAGHRRRTQGRAKRRVKFHRERLTLARAHLAEADGQLRAFIQSHPWLRDDLASIHKDYKDAEAKESAIRRQIAEIEAAIPKLRKDFAKQSLYIVGTDQPNPKYPALQDQLIAAQTDLVELSTRGLNASKEVSQKYFQLRKAPELLA